MFEATKFKHICLMMVVAMLTTGLVSCSQKVNTQTEVLTQKVLSPDKIPITVLVKNAFTINTFEKEVEKKFSNIDIIQVGNYSSNMGIAEYEARLKNGDLTDIVMTWPLDVGEEYWSQHLLDLSSFSFTGKYATSMLDNISKDGKLYYLPGPSQVRGIVYNKTLFEEKGWSVPTDFDSFIKLCKTIEESGIRSFQLGLGNQEVLDTAFVGFGYEQSFSKPENAHKIKNYNNGIGSFADNYTPALETFQVLIDNGILRKDDLNLRYQNREQMLFTRQCAMVEDSVLLTRMGFERNGCTDEFALMPFFNPGTQSDWARLYPVCYVGVSKQLADGKNQEKYNLVKELLEYISTPEGQAALAGDTGAMFSSLNGVAPPDIPEIVDLLPALTHGRYAVFPTLKNAQNALRLGLAAMVEGTATAADVIKMVDKENTTPLVPIPHKVLGKATEDFTLIETGNFLTDTMREESGCDIALFLDNGKDGLSNGKGLAGRLYEGEITSLDTFRVFPDLRNSEKGVMWKVTMTGADLVKTLEHSISVDNNIRGWFYYFSGLKMTYAPSAEAGSRISKITDINGDKIDSERLYSIAVMDGTIPEEYIKSSEKTDTLISGVFEKAIMDAGTISPSGDGRFTVS